MLLKDKGTWGKVKNFFGVKNSDQSTDNANASAQDKPDLLLKDKGIWKEVKEFFGVKNSDQPTHLQVQ